MAHVICEVALVLFEKIVVFIVFNYFLSPYRHHVFVSFYNRYHFLHTFLAYIVGFKPYLIHFFQGIWHFLVYVQNN